MTKMRRLRGLFVDPWLGLGAAFSQVRALLRRFDKERGFRDT